MAKKANKPRVAIDQNRFEETAQKALRGHNRLVHEVSQIFAEAGFKVRNCGCNSKFRPYSLSVDKANSNTVSRE